MEEFYHNYLKQLVKRIFDEYKKGNFEKAKQYTLELKELNKTIFFEKQLVR